MCSAVYRLWLFYYSYYYFFKYTIIVIMNIQISTDSSYLWFFFFLEFEYFQLFLTSLKRSLMERCCLFPYWSACSAKKFKLKSQHYYSASLPSSFVGPLLSEKIKVKFLFEEIWNYIHKKCTSYKVNLICIKILIPIC